MTMSIRLCALLLLGVCAAAPAFAATHTVNNTDDSGDGSLRQALKDASDGDTVSFASEVHGEIALKSSLDIDSDVVLKGPGASLVTVRRKEEGITVTTAGTVTITGITIAGGETALTLKKGKLTVLETAVVDSAGDGIANHGGRLTLVRSLVARNHGVGIANPSGTLTCVNSTIADNGGSGIAAEEGSIVAASCTIAGNGGTGIDTGNASAEVQNTLIASNVQGCAGHVTSKGYNLTDDLRCALGETGDQTTQDPRVGELAGNGGPTQTKALTGGSTAIDAGNPTGCTDPVSGGMLSADQRGARRPAGGRCDIGAFETQAVVSGTVVGRILALVDGDPVTLYELKDFAAGDPRLKQALSTDQAAVLDLLITKRLIQKEVEKQGIVVQDADVDRYIANIRERNKIDDAQLDAALTQQGLTRERYRAQVREELERAQLINREIRGKVSVSPEEIARYYQEHEGGGDGGDAQVTISQIFLKLPADASPDEVKEVEARANKIYEEVKDGADFAEVARKESEDGAAKSGGKLGSFKKGEMREDLEKAIEGLDSGEVSKPVRSSTGIHIVRVDERTGPGDKKMPDEMAEEIKEQLYAKALEDRYNRWLKEDLRQRHHVEIRP